MKLGLGPGHVVLDRDPVPAPSKGAQLPIFGLCLLWPNGWMGQDALFSFWEQLGLFRYNRHGPKSGGCCAPF